MAQELDLIVETLRDIQRANTRSSDAFEKVLNSVVNKLEKIDANTISSEFLKSYLAELARLSDDKYQGTIARFEEIEKALKAIFNEQNEHVKSSEVKEFFEVFTTNMNSFYTEVRQQKSLISSIEAKISDLTNNKSDKEDILRTISLLRNDFENINNSYKYTIDNVSSSLTSIINGLVKIDQSEVNSLIREQVDVIQKSTVGISNYLVEMDSRNARLEMILSGVATNENLKITQSVIDLILNKIETVNEKLGAVSEKVDIEGVISDTSEIKNLLAELATKKMYTDLAESADLIINRTDNIKQELATIIQNISLLPDTEYLKYELINLHKNIDNLDAEIVKANSKELVEEIANSLAPITSELNLCKNIITDLSEVVSNKVLNSINEISFEHESYDIKNSIAEMIKLLPQKDDVERIIDSYEITHSALEELVGHTDKILDKMDNLPTHSDMESLNSNQLSLVENLQEVANKADIDRLGEKIEAVEKEVKQVNFNEEFDTLYRKTSSIENWLLNSNLKEATSNIADQLQDKPDKESIFKVLDSMDTIITSVEELSNNADAKKVKNTLSDVYKMIELLKDDFVATSEMHNDSIIVHLSELQTSIDTIVTGEEFETFTDDIKMLVSQVVSSIDKSDESYKGIIEYQNAIIAKLDAVDISAIASILDIREDVSYIKSKSDNIEQLLLDAESKNKTSEILEKVNEKSDKSDVLNVLSVVESLVENIKSLSKEDTSLAIFNKFDDIQTNLSIVKTELLNLGVDNNSLIVGQLTELQNSITTLISGEKFESFSDEMKSLVSQVVKLVDKSDENYNKIAEYQNIIIAKLDSIDVSAIATIFEMKEDLSYVKDKSDDIEQLLQDFENTSINKSDELLSKVSEKSEKSDVLNVLSVVESLVESIKSLSKEDTTQAVIYKFDELQSVLSDVKSELMNSNISNKDSVVEILSDIKNTLGSLLKGESFDISIVDLKSSISNIFDKLEQNLSDSQEFKARQESIETKLETIDISIVKEVLSVKEDIEGLKAKASSIEDWLANSNIKENTEELIAQVQSKSDKEDVLKVLQIVESIVGELSDITQNDSVETLKDTILDACQKLEDLKTELISTSEMYNDTVVEHLSELQGSIENIVNGSEFDTFTEEIKQFLEAIVTNTDKIASDYQDIKLYQDTILSKLENIDTQVIKEVVENRSSVVEDTLTSISEYLNTVNKIDTSDIKNTVYEIKEILQNKKSSINELESNKIETVDLLEDYLTEIKRILDVSDFAATENIKSKLIKIDEDLELYKAQNENSITEIISKLDDLYEYATTLDEPFSNEDLKSSMAEISEIKDMILNLGESYRNLKYEEESVEQSLTSFVAAQLEDFGNGLDDLTESVTSQLQQGFAYNASLLDEKATLLLDFIQDLKHENSQNVDLYERLLETDSKLLDYKQELELINTDVVSTINSRADKLTTEIEPIKQMLLELINGSKLPEVFANAVNELHSELAENVSNSPNVSNTVFEKLEYSFDGISQALADNEVSIKDFIRTDIDALLHKFEELRDDIDVTLNGMVPPEVESMKEFKEFVEKINDFKSSYDASLNSVAEDIKETLSNKIDENYNELKSMLSVSLNNDKIIKAIETLQENILSGAIQIKQIQQSDNEIIDVDVVDSDFEDNNQASSIEIIEDTTEIAGAINSEAIESIIDGLKEDYAKFANEVKILSGENAAIKEVLEIIRDKMDNIVIGKVADSSDLSGDVEDKVKNPELYKDVILSETNFNFFEALNCFKDDVKNVHDEVEKIVPEAEYKDVFLDSQKFPLATFEGLFAKLDKRLDVIARHLGSGEWLEEIKNYITEGSIGTTLNLILGKLDILALTDSTDWVKDVKFLVDKVKEGNVAGAYTKQIASMIKLLNDKVDILANSDDYELFEELREIIQNTNFEQKVETTNLLNLLSEKLDFIANSNDDIDLGELTTKLDVLDTKIDIIANSNDDVDLDELKTKLDVLDTKVDIVAGTDSSEDFEDIKYVLDRVDEKVSIVKELSDSDMKITSILEVINNKIDVLYQSDSELTQKEFKDVKDLIMAQIDYIDSLEKSNKTDAVKKCLRDLTVEVNNLNPEKSARQIQKSVKEMKDTIMDTVVSVFDQVSFVEESEDLKDFFSARTEEINQNVVEVTNKLKEITSARTDEINQNLVEVTNRLKEITSDSDFGEYTYSMQDIESDLAKLRLVIKDSQQKDQEYQRARMSSIMDNITNLGATVNNIQNSLSNEEMLGLKLNFDRLNTDVMSLNSLSNQLLVSTGESYKAINDNFEQFSKLITEQLGSRVDKVTKLLETSNASDTVMRQALIYVGEWIDSASESMNKISSNSEEIIDVKSAIDGLKQSMPDHSNTLTSLENKFDEQQQRIDRLEMTIEKILSAVEDIDDTRITRKIDKLEKQLSKLSINVEKLASYVD